MSGRVRIGVLSALSNLGTNLAPPRFQPGPESRTPAERTAFLLKHLIRTAKGVLDRIEPNGDVPIGVTERVYAAANLINIADQLSQAQQTGRSGAAVTPKPRLGAKPSSKEVLP